MLIGQPRTKTFQGALFFNPFLRRISFELSPSRSLPLCPLLRVCPPRCTPPICSLIYFVFCCLSLSALDRVLRRGFAHSIGRIVRVSLRAVVLTDFKFLQSTKMASPWSVNLKKSSTPPADLTGDVPNAGSKSAESEAPAFAGVALKKTNRPADFDGSSPNVGVKQTDSLEAPKFSLRSTEGGVRD